MNVLDLEQWDAFRALPRRSRKLHICDGCCSTIAPGEHYLALSYLSDDSWSDEAACFGCWWAATVLCDGSGTIAPSCLVELLREEIDQEGTGPEGRRATQVERQLLASVLRRQRVSVAGRVALGRVWAHRADLAARRLARTA